MKMSPILVTCAGCGKKYKGSPGNKKFKCGCGNRFTYPDMAKAPSLGHVLCSNCWTEVPSSDDLKACPACSQKLSSRFTGRAVLEGADAASTEPEPPKMAAEPAPVAAVGSSGPGVLPDEPPEKPKSSESQKVEVFRM